MNALKQVEQMVDALIKLSPDLDRAKKALAEIAASEHDIEKRMKEIVLKDDLVKSALRAAENKLNKAQSDADQLADRTRKQMEATKNQIMEDVMRTHKKMTEDVAHLTQRLRELNEEKGSIMSVLEQLQNQATGMRSNMKRMQDAAATVGKMSLSAALAGVFMLLTVLPAWALQATVGGEPRRQTVMSGVITNTTTTAINLPIGPKSFYGQVVGTGTVTQTQAIYGDIDSDAANGILLCTITLSATTRGQDACPVVTANFSYYYVITTATTGTSATGAIYVIY